MTQNQDKKQTYDFAKYYDEIDQLPIKQEDRIRTDIICIYIGVAYTVFLGLLAIILFNKETYTKSSFPTDADGNTCSNQLPSYPYVYFANLPDTSKRLCVAECPSSTDTRLNCYMTKSIGCKFQSTPGFQVNYYETKPQANRLGMFCMPTDPTLKEQVLKGTRLQSKYVFINSIDNVFESAIATLLLSMAYCALVQCIPQTMAKYTIYLGVLANLILIIMVISYNTPNLAAKLVVAVILLVLLVLLIFNLKNNRKPIKVFGVFVEAASLMMNTDYYWNFGFVALFLGLSIVFMVVLVGQFQSFWSASGIHFNPSQSLFWQYNGVAGGILTPFLLVQAVWGFSFLKQAFNFLISCTAVSWYYKLNWNCLRPTKYLIFYHIGSVIGASLITGFFSLFDYIYDLFKSDGEQLQQGACQQFCTKYLRQCLKLLDLVRSDSMAYMVAAGTSFCNSARFCQYLCFQSVIIKQSQSSSRAYRFCSHLLITGLIGLLSIPSSKQISLYSLILMLILSLFLSTFFIAAHADAAEAIQMLFLLNEELEKRRIEFDGEDFDRDDPDAYDVLNFKNERIFKAICAIREEQENEEGEQHQ